jgi:hypothetical protein
VSKKHWLSILFLVACGLLTGCTVSIAATVNPDGAGELSVIYKLNQDDQKSFTQSGMSDASKLCEGMVTMSESFQGKGTIKQEKHGSETWCVMSQSFGSLEEMRTGLDNEGFSINMLSIENGRFSFDASMDTGDSASDAGIGMPIGITFELTLPGKAITHNADKVKGYTLIWELGLGQMKPMHAESGVEGRSTDWLAILQKPWVILPCIGVIVAVLVVLIIGELRRGSLQHKSEQPPASGG